MHVDVASTGQSRLLRIAIRCGGSLLVEVPDSSDNTPPDRVLDQYLSKLPPHRFRVHKIAITTDLTVEAYLEALGTVM